MLHAKVVDVSKEKIDLDKAKKFIASSKFGASIYFVGTVRDQNDNKKVTGITYDSHDALVIKSFEKIYKEAETKFKEINYAYDILKDDKKKEIYARLYNTIFAIFSKNSDIRKWPFLAFFDENSDFRKR